MSHQLIVALLECIIIAFGAGLVFGIFGSGSGLIMMPGYYYVLRHFSLASSHQMQIAVATTAAVSAVLGVFSSRQQYQNGNIDFSLSKKMLLGLTLGTLTAVLCLNIIPSAVLKKLFGIVVILVAIWLISYKAENDHRRWTLNGIHNHIRCFIIAWLWFMLGVAVFLVPYLHKCGITMRRAIGSASFISSTFCVLAAILLISSGSFLFGIHGNQIGFVNTWIFFISLIPSAIAGTLGAKLSVRIPQHQLKTIYAGLILVVGLLMII
jgi:uncharacterized membrane protein YfcA